MTLAGTYVVRTEYGADELLPVSCATQRRGIDDSYRDAWPALRALGLTWPAYHCLGEIRAGECVWLEVYDVEGVREWEAGR